MKKEEEGSGPAFQLQEMIWAHSIAVGGEYDRLSVAGITVTFQSRLVILGLLESWAAHSARIESHHERKTALKISEDADPGTKH